MGFWPNLADVEERPRASAPRAVKQQQIVDPLALGCSSCGLKSQWNVITTPRMKITGNVNGDILCLAEGPGETEDRQGAALVGPSGKILRDRIPHRHKDRVAYQNIVRCRPSDNRAPTLAEAHACSIHLDQDIADMKNLRYIIGIGGTPLRRFFPGASIMQVHGLKFPVMVNGKPLWYYPILHPAFILHQNRDSKRNKMAEATESVFNADLARFFDSFERWDKPRVDTVSPTDVIIPQSREEAQAYLDMMTDPIAVDLESSKLRPYERGSELLTAAFSDGKTTIAFSCNHPSAPTTWGTDLVIDTICQRPWIAHNASHELSWFEYYYGKTSVVNNNPIMPFYDSMAYARLLHEHEGGLDLGSVSHIHLGLNVKKLSQINAERIMDYPLSDILPYNGLDAWASARIQRRLHSKVNQQAYQRILGAIAATVHMELAGLPYDLQAVVTMESALLEQRNTIRTNVRKLYEVRQYEAERGIEFKITSPEQVGTALVAYGKLDLPLTAKQKQYSTDDEVISKHADTNPLARAVLDDREISKVLTYFDPVKEAPKLYPDGLLHPTYTTMHTATLRLSSRGPNIQNVPVRKHSEVRRYLVPPKGHLLCKFDYGQLQMRIQGWASKDRNLNSSIIDHVDIHSYWLDQLLSVYPDYIDRLAHDTGETNEKKVRKSGRNVIKSHFVFSSLFGSSAETSSERTGIPLRYVQEVLGFFWETYRGVRTWQKDQYRVYRDQGIIRSVCGQVWRGIATGTEPVNYPIQMGESEIVMDSLNDMHQIAKETGDHHFHPVMQVHDDLTYFLPEKNPQPYVDVIWPIMTKIRYPFQCVPLTVELKSGYNWDETYEVDTYEGSYTGR